jgi:hypothetical protein
VRIPLHQHRAVRVQDASHRGFVPVRAHYEDTQRRLDRQSGDAVAVNDFDSRGVRAGHPEGRPAAPVIGTGGVGSDRGRRSRAVHPVGGTVGSNHPPPPLPDDGFHPAAPRRNTSTSLLRQSLSWCSSQDQSTWTTAPNVGPTHRATGTASPSWSVFGRSATHGRAPRRSSQSSTLRRTTSVARASVWRSDATDMAT